MYVHRRLYNLYFLNKPAVLSFIRHQNLLGILPGKHSTIKTTVKLVKIVNHIFLTCSTISYTYFYPYSLFYISRCTSTRGVSIWIFSWEIKKKDVVEKYKGKTLSINYYEHSTKYSYQECLYQYVVYQGINTVDLC